MKPRAILFSLVCGATLGTAATEDRLDRLGDALTLSAHGDQVRARLSGTLDLEGYSLQQPTPGLIYTTDRYFLNPRLSMFVDAQLGPQWYAFAQARVDRGFDPGAAGPRVRFDEYAVRFTPGAQGRIHLQAGKFATILGNWVTRHGSWQNPFVTAPLPYENLTGIWDASAARSSGQLLAWAHLKPTPPVGNEEAEKVLRTPLIWGPSYTTGLAAFGQFGRFEAAVDLKNAAPSSHPETWEARRAEWRDPTYSGRLTYRPSPMWSFGLSASTGPYLTTAAGSSLAPGRTRGDYRQILVGQDIGFAWHHWQVWTEVYATRFAVPNVGNADSLAYYAEAKYKFTAQLFGAVRWNQHLFATIPDARGGHTRWGRPATRIDLAAGFRFTPHLQGKLQYSLQREETRQHDRRRTIAVQFTVRL